MIGIVDRQLWFSSDQRACEQVRARARASRDKKKLPTDRPTQRRVYQAFSVFDAFPKAALFTVLPVPRFRSHFWEWVFLLPPLLFLSFVVSLPSLPSACLLVKLYPSAEERSLSARTIRRDGPHQGFPYVRFLVFLFIIITIISLFPRGGHPSKKPSVYVLHSFIMGAQRWDIIGVN